MAIRKSLKKGEYTQAILLAQDGEAADRQWPGLVHKWRNLRLEAYTLAGDVEGQRQLARELLLAGDFEYYARLKATYDEHSWKPVYQEIKEGLRRARLHSPIFARVLIEEDDFGDLLEVVRANPEKVLDYHRYLLPEYSSEVYEIWTLFIRHAAKNAGSRGHYSKVCGYIKKLIKAGGETEARKLIAELTEAYKRRPTFIDELSRVRI